MLIEVPVGVSDKEVINFCKGSMSTQCLSLNTICFIKMFFAMLELGNNLYLFLGDCMKIQKPALTESYLQVIYVCFFLFLCATAPMYP